MGKSVEESYNKPDYYDYGNFSGESVFYPTVIALNEDKNGLFLEEGIDDLSLSENDFVF